MASETWETLLRHTQFRSSVHHGMEHAGRCGPGETAKWPTPCRHRKSTIACRHRKSTIALHYVDFNPGLSQ